VRTSALVAVPVLTLLLAEKLIAPPLATRSSSTGQPRRASKQCATWQSPGLQISACASWRFQEVQKRGSTG
jgi:hypothetical protein